MARKTKTYDPDASLPLVVETFARPTAPFVQAEPTSFNGIVRVRRYRVTIEVIDEPVEVIHARITKLWREGDNYHHSEPIKQVARKYGLTLRQEDWGVDRRQGGR